MSEPAPKAPAPGVSVAKGVARAAAMSPVGPAKPRGRALSMDELEAGVIAGDRAVMGRALSLVESSRPEDEQAAQVLLERLLPRAGRSIRVGITGVPGAGKSTFIERLGLMLGDEGRRVAVLAVDPSSALSGGSVLGDRTRMTKLSAHPGAFIRPSPSGGTLGGVARRTREAMIVCEAAGYGVVLVETVGVGQSETAVADMTDVFLALAIAGAGDELQGVKRGLLERVDVVAVNKADGDNAPRASLAARELSAALHVMRGGDEEAIVLTCSALTGEGVGAVWGAVNGLFTARAARGEIEGRRREQAVRWLRSLIDDRVAALLRGSPAAQEALAKAEEGVRAGATLAGAAARRVVEALLGDLRSHEQN
jgi:LAO/AO transport system kinase